MLVSLIVVYCSLAGIVSFETNIRPDASFVLVFLCSGSISIYQLFRVELSDFERGAYGQAGIRWDLTCKGQFSATYWDNDHTS